MDGDLLSHPKTNQPSSPQEKSLETIAPSCHGSQTGKEQYSDDQKLAIPPQAVQAMTTIPNSSLFYNSDDGSPDSPILQPITVKATPSPSPPPPISQVPMWVPRKRRRREGKTLPSQGDEVLMISIDPNRPDIARVAGQSPLNSASEYETSESENERLYEVAERGTDSETDNTGNKKIFQKKIKREDLPSELEEAFGPAKAA
ncbi:hypothetical protein K469DRAFT_746652 [Zopfia rhizophila CBS 207.26]|uniref:Uncharacterized protein n=1 Tax=Zopfia rhizophila CBS 207.26 TaxID=1314779 RepID=A0A6A6EGU0_9PEZI|nr:hypothetical protein K469DRAFT_746652 [Zopfia rhizophila CBS 207.26]